MAPPTGAAGPGLPGNGAGARLKAPTERGWGNGWHDGLGVDVCGNLYVPDFSSDYLCRITPAGVGNVFMVWNSACGGYGFGIGGWPVEDLRTGVLRRQPGHGGRGRRARLRLAGRGAERAVGRMLTIRG